MTDTLLTTASPCPCGGPAMFGACCLPIIQGSQPALTAEQLMRSRYSAHVYGAVDYLLSSWHTPDTSTVDRDAIAHWATQSQWCQLIIHSSRKGQPQDSEGWVEFSAYYRAIPDSTATSLTARPPLLQHRELSHFIQLDGNWFYLSGEVRDNPPSPSRNDPCPCGSGKKYKRCCHLQ